MNFLPLLKHTLGAAALAAAALSLPSLAQAQVNVTGGSVTPLADDSLFKAFGGEAGLTRLTDDFVQRLSKDPKVGAFFKDTKLSELAASLKKQFCVVSGGPCVYDGASMKDAHADMEVRKADFNRLVEVLQQSMDAQGIPFATQNRLLAQLAPMHRDVINTR